MQGDFHIGDRLVQPRINSIQFEGETIRLEPKVMQVLLVLSSNPGEVFTREQIRDAVWRDVFVGDDVLMRAVSEIRRIFDDDPRTPHIVQTVPKVGYRLIASVSQTSAAPKTTTSVATIDEPPITLAVPLLELPAATIQQIEEIHAPRESRRTLWMICGVAATVFLVAMIGLRYLQRDAVSHEVVDYISHPLTTYPGSQVQPALSPDGDAVAFIWSKGPDDTGHLYVKSLNSGAPARVTSESGQDFSPAWSPNGRSLAYIRRSGSESVVEIVAVVGGSERRVYTLPGNSVFQYGGLTWTPDGDHIIFPQQTPLGCTQLVELSLSTHSIAPLTTPPSHWSGDWMPAVSPDGSKLAFVRGAEQSTRDIYVMNLPDGTPRALTSDAHLVLGLTWTADGSRIVFASNRGGSLGLWSVADDRTPPKRELAGTDGAYWPTIARRGELLAYTHGNASWSIVSIPLDGTREPSETEVLTSSEQDASPQVSPVGDRLAFQSWRSGGQEIWTSAIDGSNLIQLTSQGASAGSPSWSRDARFIAYDARPTGFPHIYISDTDGANPRAITNGSFSDIVPSWSHDDRWIYFGSNRSGDWQIWRTASDGHGSSEQVTQSGGMVAKESPDGKWVYYTKVALSGVWRLPVGGGAEHMVCAGPAQGDQNYWTLSGHDLFVLSPTAAGRSFVRVEPETGRTTPVSVLKHDPTPFTGLTVTPDRKHLLFAELREAQSNITLVEHYR